MTARFLRAALRPFKRLFRSLRLRQIDGLIAHSRHAELCACNNIDLERNDRHLLVQNERNYRLRLYARRDAIASGS